MPLSSDQQAEIDQARAGAQPTLRPVAPALEEILYEALPVLDHGFVRVVDYMGDDAAVVQAARVSYGRGTRKTSEDRGLIRYLMRHWHTTPFEMAAIKFHVKLPIFVARQWIRHRTASVNEYSARYSVLDRAGVTYRIAYSSAHYVGQIAPVLAGLAVAPIPKSIIDGNLMAVEDGSLPPLGFYEIQLLRAPRATGAAIDALAGHIEASFSAESQAA